MGFEPKIVGFLCNWCSYAGADLAGVSRFQYPPNVRVIRVMCSGRIDPVLVLEALICKADGVLIGGCHLGDCHYISGNYQAERKFKIAQRLVKEAGLEPERVRLEWVSASEGKRFAEVIQEFTEQITAIGPSPLKTDERLLNETQIMQAVAADSRIRALVGKERDVTELGNVYGEKVSMEHFNELLDQTVYDVILGQRVLRLMDSGAKSVKDISSEVGASPQEVLKSVVELKRQGLVAMDHIEGHTPFYASIVGGE